MSVGQRKKHEIQSLLSLRKTKTGQVLKAQGVRAADSATALITDNKAYELFLKDILAGKFGAKSLIAAEQSTGLSIARLRPIALAAYQQVQYCQTLSDDATEQRKIIKADITEKLNMLFETATKNKDIKSANAVLTNLAKLNHLYDDSIKLNNNIALMSLTPTQAERLTSLGEIPEDLIIVEE